MTIEKPLYFCSRKFVGEFPRVTKAAISGKTVGLCRLLISLSATLKRLQLDDTRDEAQEPSSIEQHRASRGSRRI
jgi:hypothetical protein